MDVRQMVKEYIDHVYGSLHPIQYNCVASAFLSGMHAVIQGRDEDVTRQIVEMLKDIGTLPKDYQIPSERN